MTEIQLSESQRKSSHCGHTDQARPVSYARHECAECVAKGDRWVQLRICMTCGHVGCCDSSKNKHATAHYKSTGHPIIKSIEPGGDWAWCYVDESYLR